MTQAATVRRAFDCPDYEPVPTVAELVKMGLAVPSYTKGEPARYTVKPEGEALIRSAMRRNVWRQRAWEEAGRPEGAE